MSSLDDFKSRFYKFREKRFALPLALLLTFMVCSLLLLYSSALCFGYLAIAVIAYYVPYFFGMKDRKKLVVFGVVLFILIAIPYGVSNVSNLQGNADRTVSSEDGTLFDGRVAPFNAVESNVYNYTVTVSDPAITNVWLSIIDTRTNRNFNSPDQNITMDQFVTVGSDRQFYEGVPLQDQSIYGFRFSAENGTALVETGSMYGPITMPDGDLYVTAISGAILSTFFSVGVLFFLLLLMTWFTDRSRKRAQEMQKTFGMPPAAGGEKANEERFVCSECGASVPADAKSCPQCGESFEEDMPAPAAAAKEDEYYCTDCGATVKESDAVCPNCGKKFED